MNDSQLKIKDRRTFLYAMIMLIAGIGVFRLPNMSGPYVALPLLMLYSFLFQLASIAIGFGIKLARRLFKRTDEVLFSKDFWLDTVEEGFAAWCWLVVAILFRYFQWFKIFGEIKIF